MIKELVELGVEAKQICIDIVAITGKSAGEPLNHITPALRIYKKFLAYGLYEKEIEEIVDEAIKNKFLMKDES